MADFTPTRSQAQAITTRGSTVLVSAGAGSGKTRVLTERLMAYIQSGEADIDSFLIITYTRAAAAELRGRIMEELSKALSADPASKRLRRQNALCRYAHIGTIHSFCADLLREFSHAAGISPEFKILDDDRARSMKLAALERTLEDFYLNHDEHPGFLLLADTVGIGRDDSRLAELVLNLHEKMQCHARPEQWARQQVELLDSGAADAADTPWGREIMDRAGEIAAYWSAELDRVMSAMSGNDKISKAYMPAVSETADAVRELTRCLGLGWDKAREKSSIPFPRLGVLRNSPDPELSEFVKSRREACRKAMKGVSEMLYSDSAKLLAEMELTAPAMAALLELTLQFDREYSRDKRRAALLDYSDLEHHAAALLTNGDGSPTDLAQEISGRYTEIMVDEYQDVSRVQDAIFSALSGGGKKLFFVGDVKQSIYRFRLADPAIFTEKYLAFADADTAVGSEARKIMLSENFRSRREILDAANAVFSRCMSRKLGDIDYDGAAALKYGAGYADETEIPELLLLDLRSASDEDETPDKTRAEAELAAEKIAALYAAGTEVTGKNGPRRMEYSDVAILLRSANTVGGIYREALIRRGIPVASVQSGAFFTSVEISTLMSMLALTDNPHQDIPLIAVLRSPSFLFGADELSMIRASSRSGDFYSALCAYAEKDEKARRFIDRLSELRRAAPDISVSELTWEIIERLDLQAICAAMGDAEQRLSNLMGFAELAERFESTGYRGLHRFVLWLRQLAQKGKEPAGSGTGAGVQIMSVHRSKGLEFPIVFLCDTARRFNRKDSQDTVLVHPVLGLGAKLTDLKRRVEYPTLARNAIKLRLEREMLSEEMRLLYVAMTRPKERLYITAAMKEPEKQVEKLRAAVTEPLAPELLMDAAAPVNWLIAAAIADGEKHLRMRFCGSAAEPAAGESLSEEKTDAADYGGELRRRLDFVYPHGEAVKLPSKVTATELKGRMEVDGDAQSTAPVPGREFRLPDFVKKDKPLTGTERGIAAHLVLQYMDYSKADSIESIRGEIERLSQGRFITEREARAVDPRVIYRLFASDIGRRIRSADKLLREFKFSLLCDAEDIFGEAAGEQVLLQGVVDCCIEEHGELTVIDYKTDSVRTDEEIAARTELYRSQLRSYAVALERIFKKPVRECVLYFISAGKEVPL